MEKEKNTFKQVTKKTQIGSSGGGNIGGLLLLGGALAVGSLVATLAARKGNRRRDSDDQTSRSKLKEEKASQGLHFILETSSTTFHGNQCCSSNGFATQIDPSEFISTPSLILEENPSSGINSSLQNSDNDDREISLTYDSKQDSIEMCSNYSRVEQFSLPDQLKNDMVKDTNLMATTEISERDAIDAVRTRIEEISSVQSIEEDDAKEEDKKRKQAKEKLLSEEIIEVAEKEEPIDLKTCAEKNSLDSVEEEDGDNLGRGLLLMEMIEVKQEEEAIDEVEEDDAIDAVKIRIEEILSVQSANKKEDDDEEENKQAKEKLLLVLEEKFEEEEERISENTCAEKTSLNSVEEDDGDDNSGKGSALMDIHEVKQEEAIDVVKISIEEISSVQSTDKEEDDDEENKQAKEKLLLEEKFKIEEEERIAEKTCVEKTSLNSVEEDNSDDNLGKGSALMNKPEVKQDEDAIDEVAEEDAIDVVKMSIEEISSVQSMEEDDDDNEEENKHSIDDIERSDDAHILKKSEENSAGTGTSSAGSDAEKIWPAESFEALSQELMNIMKTSRLSAAKTAEQDENNKTEEFSHFNSCTDIIQTTRNSTFTKKEANLEFTVWNKQTTYLRKWKIAGKHMLIMASIVLLFLSIAMHYFIYLLRNDI